jgi:hypothetical protein
MEKQSEEHECKDCARLFKECGEPSYFEECRHEDWGRWQPKIEKHCDICADATCVTTEGKLCSAPHFHHWDDGAYYSHSHAGGNLRHGHHGSRYGMPESKNDIDGIAASTFGVFPKKTGAELIAQERQRQIEKEGWTPDDPIRELIKAGALIAAEIDRLNIQRGFNENHS